MGRRPGDPKLSSLRSYSCRRGSLIPVAREDFSWQLRERCLNFSLEPSQPSPDSSPQVHTHLAGCARVHPASPPQLLHPPWLQQEGSLGLGSAGSVTAQKGKEIPLMGLWSTNRFRIPGLENLGLLTAEKNCTWENESENSVLSIACQSPLSTMGCFGTVVFSGEEPLLSLPPLALPVSKPCFIIHCCAYAYLSFYPTACLCF